MDSCCVALAVLVVLLAALALNVRAVVRRFQTDSGLLPSAKAYPAIEYSGRLPSGLPDARSYDRELAAFLLHTCESAVNLRLGAPPMLPRGLTALGLVGGHALLLQVDQTPLHIVAIAGTLAYEDVRSDLSVKQVDFYGTRAHSGFAGVWSQVYPGVRSFLEGAAAPRLLVTGHSLGAAVATLLALAIAVDFPSVPLALYASATPRTGDQSFVDALGARVPNRWHLTNRSDIVPTLPPAALSIHGEPVEYADFDRAAILGAQTGSLGGNHNMSAYLCALGKACPPGATSVVPPIALDWTS